MQIVVFEDPLYANLLPLAYWRAVFELRCGRDSLLSKVSRAYEGATISLHVRNVLRQVVVDRLALSVTPPSDADRVLYLNGRLLLTAPLEIGQWPSVGIADGAIVYAAADRELAARLATVCFQDDEAVGQALTGVPRVDVSLPPRGMIRYPWDLVHANGPELMRQWDGAAGVEGQIDRGAFLLGEDAIHIGRGSRVKPCTVVDAEEGPVYIGENVTVSPNCTIQGPCYIGDGTLIQPGAVIRDGTSLGPACKVGGEIEASIIHGYSNKQHDGFLGHSYLGEWINIAADCINSDLKNTYGEVTVPVNGVEVKTGETFAGLTMGDHSKGGINLSFPTGAVVGFASNVFLSRHPPKFVPSFSWYTDADRGDYDPRRGVQVARRVMARRKKRMSSAEEQLFLSIEAQARETEARLAPTE